ncbi:hypothetical protein NQZ68_011352 [Dissostichus eleginoides]|nr:hypothetical protein NQZ68_011352 [Dissostichus eleginoides]
MSGKACRRQTLTVDSDSHASETSSRVLQFGMHIHQLGYPGYQTSVIHTHGGPTADWLPLLSSSTQELFFEPIRSTVSEVNRSLNRTGKQTGQCAGSLFEMVHIYLSYLNKEVRQQHSLRSVSGLQSGAADKENKNMASENHFNQTVLRRDRRWHRRALYLIRALPVTPPYNNGFLLSKNCGQCMMESGSSPGRFSLSCSVPESNPRPRSATHFSDSHLGDHLGKWAPISSEVGQQTCTVHAGWLPL